jgi:hypothetical protein
VFAIWSERRENAFAWSGYAAMNILNDTFIVKYDETLDSILIIHPDEESVPSPIVRIRAETLDSMDFLEASQFLGERLMLLLPQLRRRYAADLAKLANAKDAKLPK